MNAAHVETSHISNGNRGFPQKNCCKLTGVDHGDHEGDGRKSSGLRRPDRDDRPFERNVFPDTPLGQLLDGIIFSYLIKQEPRMGWAMRLACSEAKLSKHPCEVVASHQWGVSWLVMCLVGTPDFRSQMPSNFSLADAMQMAQIHDVPELIVTDITPSDGISPEEKHRRESIAIKKILARFPKETADKLRDTYERYERRQCNESKFVKDCDRLDFMLTAFMLERQGFKGFHEFYENSNKEREFHTDLARNLADLLLETRNRLAREGNLYPD